jgi:hypothetical protein
MNLHFTASDDMAPPAWVGNSGTRFIRDLDVAVHPSLRKSKFIEACSKRHLSSHAIFLLLLQKIPKDQLLALG